MSMTENKAVETLEYIKTFDGMDFGATKIALDMAIQALEEIQQYRAIGTVRQVQDFIADWRKFREIGNLEEFKDLKEKIVAKKVKGKHMSDSLEERNLCGEYTLYGYCPNCGEHITNLWNSEYCGDCGQALDCKGGANNG